jgi:hypothetical protein
VYFTYHEFEKQGRQKEALKATVENVPHAKEQQAKCASLSTVLLEELWLSVTCHASKKVFRDKTSHQIIRAVVGFLYSMIILVQKQLKSLLL